MISKSPKESLAITTDIILPSETNQMNTLFGGELLARLDRVAYISACRHSGVETLVTASVNNVSFSQAVPVGSIVTMESKVSRAFKSSMEIIIDVYLERVRDNTKKIVNEAIYTFAAVDKQGKKIIVPRIVPETSLEKKRYSAALRRRQLSLLLAGKIHISEATELKTLFK